MVSLLVKQGLVVTQNATRDCIEGGAVAIDGDRIVAVGPSAELADGFDADRVIDAGGHTIIPGLVNPHTHVSDILLRGSCGTDRGLYDWLFNIKRPGLAVMTADDHELAAAAYCQEALTTGVTTFVENDGGIPHGNLDGVTAKFDAFESSGIRSIYARGVRDRPTDDEFRTLVDRITAREPTVTHPDGSRYVADLDRWLEELETLYADYHGTADGRHEIWAAPGVVEGMTDEGLREMYRFAAEHDVMTTVHTAEAPEQAGGPLSPIERLRNAGALGEHALLGHCVQVDDRDVRILARTDTRVAHNIASNLALGNGFAPVPSMRARGVTVGLGTDNTSLSDTVNPLSDLRLMVLAHSGNQRDPGVIDPQEALDMVTIEAARAIRKENELGSLEPGKLADLVLLDLDRPYFTPMSNVVSALVYQAQGTEVDTVICDGNVVVEDGTATGIAATYPDLHDRATAATRRILAEAGLAESDNI